MRNTWARAEITRYDQRDENRKKILQPLLGIFLSLSSQFFFTGKAHNNISSRDKDVDSRDKALLEAKTSIFFPVFL